MPVHPRVCGEEHLRVKKAIWLCGSPPRVRGGADRVYAGEGGTRFTPACAGRSVVDTIIYNTPAVHPRVCGEESYCVLSGACSYGSPPRVRGGV